VIVAASVDANSILADDFQSIVAVKCFFTVSFDSNRVGLFSVLVLGILPL